MTKVLCVLLLALTVASARTLSGQRAVYNYQPKTNSVLWVPVNLALNCRSTCASANMVSVAGGPSFSGPIDPPAVLCANIGSLYAAGAVNPEDKFLDEGATRPGNTTGDRCASYLQGTAINSNAFLCGCIPPKKSKTMQKWVPANDPNGCPSDYYRVPFVCRLATASNVFIGHVNSQACGFPNAVAQPTCTAAGQLASGYADNPKPNQLNMPPRETGPQGPTCLYRSPFPESLQLEANLGEYQRLCIYNTFKYLVYDYPDKTDAAEPSA